MKIGMAEILRRRSLELKHFNAFREVTFALIEKHQKQNRRAQNVGSILSKTHLQKMIRAIHLYALRSKTNNRIVNQVQA